MIKNIIFDLGGVVMTNGTRIYADKICKKHGLDFRSVINEFSDENGAGELYRTGKITREQFYQIVIRKFNLNENADTIEDEWIACYDLNQETIKLINNLRNSYQLYYLSNSVKERIRKLNQRFNLTSYFVGGVFSHEVGIRKPNPEIYKIILNKYNLIPEESIFIDDKEKNLPPARELGMKTILFASAEDLKQQLHNLSVLS